MPTRKEVTKIKADYIDKRDEAINAKIDSLQQDLFDNILGDFISLAKEEDVKKRLNAGDLNTLESKVRKGMREKFPEVIKELVKSSRAIGDLNLMYFSTLVDSTGLDEIRNKTEKALNKRLGIDESGKTIKGGFLDNTLASQAVQKRFVNEVKQLVQSNRDVQGMQQRLKEMFTGNRNQNGLITQYYNTFAKDILTNIDRSSSAVYAKELDLKHAYYEGGLLRTSRSFCLDKNGKIFPLDVIMKWKDSTFIKNMYGDKIDEYDPIEGPPGGYGCNHILSWITEDLAKGNTREQNKIAADRNKAFKERNGL